MTQAEHVVNALGHLQFALCQKQAEIDALKAENDALKAKLEKPRLSMVEAPQEQAG